MQHHPHGQPTRSSPTQSRSRRPVLRPVESPDVVQDLRNSPAASSAHTRAPVLIREPTLLESLSRNFRTFLPALPSSPPAPRRPLSIGNAPGAVHEGERIVWGAWDELAHARVLILAYETGLQIWDTRDLSAVRELLNLRAEALCSAGPVLGAAVVEPASLAVLTPAHLTLYSLITHSVVNQVPFNNPCSLVARATFLVVATPTPPILHILSPTLAPLHTFPLTAGASPLFAASHRLLAFTTPPPTERAASPSFAASTSPARALWTAVEDRAWAGLRFSRSAPAASGRWASASAPVEEEEEEETHPWVAVVDLAPLLASTPATPVQIAHFTPFPHAPHASIARLAFLSAHGGPPLLCAAPRGGQGVGVFELRGKEAVWHRYALRRGVTRARVESVVGAEGGRWVGVVTGRRTVHIFATNREGGPPDVKAHLQGRALNSEQPRPLSTELAPLVRLRPEPLPDAHELEDADEPAPLVIAFLPRAETMRLPVSLRPNAQAHSSYSHSPPQIYAHRPPTVQDMLLFDPESGILALRRVGLDEGDGVTLGARESIVATWSLQRGRAWGEVCGSVPGAEPVAVPPGEKVKPRAHKDFLAHAELSTHSAVPPPVYLSHQFSFHALQGEDYAALLAGGHLAGVPCLPIPVRRAIEVHGADSSSSASSDAEFVQDRDRRRSFDAPLASAIGAHLRIESTAPRVLPMLPNGGRAGLGARVVGRIKREIGGRVVVLPGKSPVLGAYWGDGGREEVEVVEGDGEEWGEEWDDEAGKAVEEVEMFDEISAVGFMDEEQEREREREAEKERQRTKPPNPITMPTTGGEGGRSKRRR